MEDEKLFPVAKTNSPPLSGIQRTTFVSVRFDDHRPLHLLACLRSLLSLPVTRLSPRPVWAYTKSITIHMTAILRARVRVAAAAAMLVL